MNYYLGSDAGLSEYLRMLGEDFFMALICLIEKERRDREIYEALK